MIGVGPAPLGGGSGSAVDADAGLVRLDAVSPTGEERTRKASSRSARQVRRASSAVPLIEAAKKT